MNRWTAQLWVLGVVLIAVLLIALGALQYRWVGELSEFEQDRMRDSLQTASGRFAGDFTRELDDIWRTFVARRGEEIPGAIAKAYAEWLAAFANPELVDQALWISAEPGGPEVLRFNQLSGRFEPSEWPPHLGELRDEFREDLRRRPHGERRRGSYFTPLDDETLALIVTQEYRPTQSRAIVLLRRRVLVEHLIPGRLQEYLGGDGELDYNIAIVDRTGEPGIAYNSTQADLSEADIKIDLQIPDHLDFRSEGDNGRNFLSVLLQHRAGSLEAAIERTRRRNLLIGLGVLSLLGASVIVLLAATRRAQSLADQQMEFVAGVSQELRTPVTGISSLSQNLADGVVRDLDQAATYGGAIHRESRRLADMIERVLQFSALRSGRRPRDLRPVSLSAVIDEAASAVGPSLTERFQFEKEVQESLPSILGDEQGLKSAIQNLLSNAMKFSDEGGLIRLSSRTTQIGNGREVQISVEDRGPGIPPAEQRYIFEPFYRGQAARASQVEGAGLGLSLVKDVVEAQGGRITVASSPGEGSTFTLHLPVMEATDPEVMPDGRL